MKLLTFQTRDDIVAAVNALNIGSIITYDGIMYFVVKRNKTCFSLLTSNNERFNSITFIQMIESINCAPSRWMVIND